MFSFMIFLYALAAIALLIQYIIYSHSRTIRVIYANNASGMINRARLEACIASGSITKFFRSSGWVTISVDPIRKTNHAHLGERREIATC
jgi:hypothetical protein